MRLRTRLLLLWLVFAASLIGLAISLFTSRIWLAGLCVVAWGVAARTARALPRRAKRRLDEALHRGDVEGARRIAAYMAGGRSPVTRWWLDAAVPCAQMFAGRFEEARGGFAALLPAAPNECRGVCLNNLAWAQVQLGEAALAVPSAREAVALEEVRQRVLPYCLGTLGAALQLTGESAEAAKLLERALDLDAKGADVDAAATRWFFLGEARAALGDRGGSRAAFEAAQSASPESAYGKKAADRLG